MSDNKDKDYTNGLTAKRGRPSSYSDDMIDKGYDYIMGFKELGHTIPSISSLCLYLGVASSTVYKWKDEPDKTEFSEMLDVLLDMQRHVLLNGGLDGSFNATITKLVLAKHGYIEKLESESTLKGDPNAPLNFRTAEEAALAYQRALKSS